ncbi:hypothetical protein [Streptomyces sp. PanSC9]|uniref:hypothetical protein n=1 Tax=Streptomyces sp. PanSC9 TaxID=1520461 RepID=UPI0011CE3903|nr:hypothetical protein [Streptomyces sp. PanSC9]
MASALGGLASLATLTAVVASWEERLGSIREPLPLYLSNEGPTPAHSGYFDPDRNPSAANNIAKIVAGRSDIVTTEDPR